MATNINELPQFIDMMLKLGIYVIQFPPLSRSGRARKNWEKLKLSDEQRLWFWKYIAERSEQLESRMHLLAECFSMDINASGTPHRCSIGSQVRIDPQGNAYPCQCFHFGTDYRIGHVRKQTLAEIVQGQALKNIMTTCFNRPYQIESCRQCQWINMCGGGCMGSAYETHKTVLSADACRVRKQWIEELFEERIGRVLRQV
jgi:radical SAM protein with 4Fe4S-binding SPASM domain